MDLNYWCKLNTDIETEKEQEEMKLRALRAGIEHLFVKISNILRKKNYKYPHLFFVYNGKLYSLSHKSRELFYCDINVSQYQTEDLLANLINHRISPLWIPYLTHGSGLQTLQEIFNILNTLITDEKND